jgi:hypothetical protein
VDRRGLRRRPPVGLPRHMAQEQENVAVNE